MTKDLSIVDALREWGIDVYLDERGNLRARKHVEDDEIREWITRYRDPIRGELLERKAR